MVEVVWWWRWSGGGRGVGGSGVGGVMVLVEVEEADKELKRTPLPPSLSCTSLATKPSSRRSNAQVHSNTYKPHLFFF